MKMTTSHECDKLPTSTNTRPLQDEEYHILTYQEELFVCLSWVCPILMPTPLSLALGGFNPGHFSSDFRAITFFISIVVNLILVAYLFTSLFGHPKHHRDSFRRVAVMGLVIEIIYLHIVLLHETL